MMDSGHYGCPFDCPVCFKVGEVYGVWLTKGVTFHRLGVDVRTYVPSPKTFLSHFLSDIELY